MCVCVFVHVSEITKRSYLFWREAPDCMERENAIRNRNGVKHWNGKKKPKSSTEQKKSAEKSNPSL